MAYDILRDTLVEFSDQTKAHISETLDRFRADLAVEHQDLLQEISFKVGLLASVIVDGDLSAADVESEWKDCQTRTSAQRRRFAERNYREAGK